MKAEPKPGPRLSKLTSAELPLSTHAADARPGSGEAGDLPVVANAVTRHGGKASRFGFRGRHTCETKQYRQDRELNPQHTIHFFHVDSPLFRDLLAIASKRRIRLISGRGIVGSAAYEDTAGAHNSCFSGRVFAHVGNSLEVGCAV